MRRIVLVMVVLMAFGLGAGVAVATVNGGEKPEAAAPEAESGGGATPSALGGASADQARLAALINGNGNTGNDFEVVRSKGVAAVTNPANGVFCIKPSTGSGITRPGKTVPVVTVDFLSTGYYGAAGQYDSSRLPCPSGNIKVVTLVDSGSAWFQLNNVAFTIVVP